MKTTITILALIITTSINAQTKSKSQSIPATPKTIIATYDSSLNVMELSEFYFTSKTDKKVIIFTHNFTHNKNDKLVNDEFWNEKIIGAEDEPDHQVHTVAKNKGKQYEITYVIKRVKDVGFAELTFHNSSLKTHNLALDVSGLSPGVYFVRIGSSTQKFIKQ